MSGPLPEATARDAVRRLCGGLRKALELCAAADPADVCDPRTDADLTLLAMWADRCAELGPFALNRLRQRANRTVADHASRRGDSALVASARVLLNIVRVAQRNPDAIDFALCHMDPLVPCGAPHGACEAVARAMGVEGTCEDSSGFEAAFGGPVLRACERPPERLRAWPEVGITGPGLWGSKDHLRWEFAPGGSLVVGTAPGSFKVGWTVEFPDESRELMRKQVRLYLSEFLKGWTTDA